MRVRDFFLFESLKAFLLRAFIVSASLAIVSCGNSSSEQSSSDTQATQSDTASSESPADYVKPAFDLVRISRGGTGVIAGRMAPGAKVQLLANGTVRGEVIADENGEWVIILEEPLASGSVELNLIATLDDSDTPYEAEDVVVVSVPERDDTRFMETVDNGVVAVLSSKSGEGGSTILQKPGAAAFAEVGESLFVDTIDYGAGNAPVISGRSLPRVDVRVYLDGHFVGSHRADDEGRWSVIMEGQSIPAGEHTLRVDQTIREGQVQLRIEQPFITGEAIDVSLAESGVIVQPGNTLWQIARQLYGRGVRYTLIFKENSEKIIDPDLIYPGQLFTLPSNES